jgi:hypothetical protein
MEREEESEEEEEENGDNKVEKKLADGDYEILAK